MVYLTTHFQLGIGAERIGSGLC